jgi:hypothetical protein
MAIDFAQQAIQFAQQAIFSLASQICKSINESIFAARRGGALNLPVSENDVFFCIPLYWNVKKRHRFRLPICPYKCRGELQF